MFNVGSDFRISCADVRWLIAAASVEALLQCSAAICISLALVLTFCVSCFNVLLGQISVKDSSWTLTTDNGGRDDLTSTVTISPLAQLSATVVTSTSVTVSAADYNEDYTVSVVATNCAGNSTADEYSFRVGELVVVGCGKLRA